MQYSETLDDLDQTNDRIAELQDDYPEDEGWSHDWSIDVRHDCVHLWFEAWR